MYRRGTVGDVLPNPDARRARRVVGRNSVGSRRHFLWTAEIRTGLHRSSAGQAVAQQNPLQGTATTQSKRVTAIHRTVR